MIRVNFREPKFEAETFADPCESAIDGRWLTIYADGQRNSVLARIPNDAILQITYDPPLILKPKRVEHHDA